MVRYADDFAVMCRSKEDAAAALAVVQHWTASAGLTLHPAKTRLIDERDDGFDFLGYHFEAGKRWPREKSRNKFRDTIRAKTRRTSGHSMTHIIADVNRTLRGWGAGLNISSTATARHSAWKTAGSAAGCEPPLARGLRKRSRRKGSAKANGADQTRWPNAYFAGLGLYSLQAAHTLACQSSRR
jgi:RNA-directed DNA polymerase